LEFNAEGKLYGFSNERESVIEIDPASGEAREVLNFSPVGLSGVYGASYFRNAGRSQSCSSHPCDYVIADCDPLELDCALMDLLVEDQLG
jgi:hypothetical protein